MKTLKLFDGTNEEWAILGEAAGYWGDNGGDPDGNAWLPNVSGDDLTDKIVAEVVNANLGEIVEVEEADDDQMLALLGLPPHENFYESIDEDTVDTLKEAANKQLQWAHFGAYGAMDSVWIYVKKGDE